MMIILLSMFRMQHLMILLLRDYSVGQTIQLNVIVKLSLRVTILHVVNVVSNYNGRTVGHHQTQH